MMSAGSPSDSFQPLYHAQIKSSPLRIVNEMPAACSTDEIVWLAGGRGAIKSNNRSFYTERTEFARRPIKVEHQFRHSVDVRRFDN